MAMTTKTVKITMNKTKCEKQNKRTTEIQAHTRASIYLHVFSIHPFIYLFILFETCLSLLYALRYTYGIVFGLTIKLHAIDKLIISSKSCFGFASIIENHRENKNAFPFCFGNRVNKFNIITCRNVRFVATFIIRILID